MTAILFVLFALISATIGTIARGVVWAFLYLFMPCLLLVPFDVYWTIAGLPDLSPQRAVVLGMLLGALLSGRAVDLVPRWRPFDILPLAMVLSSALSFGLRTDMHGFFYRLTILSADWGFPYILARAVLRRPHILWNFLSSCATCGITLACFSIFEARMRMRLMANLWNYLADYEVPPFWTPHTDSVRWGLLRAYGPFGHPLILATVLVALTPLSTCRIWNAQKRGVLAIAGALLIAAGTVAPVSRGPLLVLGATSAFFALTAVRLSAFSLTVTALLALTPVVAQQAQEVLQATEADLAFAGNTNSARYRLALLMIYLSDFDQLGFFGNLDIVGARYQAAWSIDNSYLYMFITGGWVGGILLLAIGGLTVLRGYRSLAAARGSERYVRAAILAAFVGMSGCIANVWFTPEFSALYLVLVALVWNQSESKWYDLRSHSIAPKLLHAKSRQSFNSSIAKTTSQHFEGEL